VACREFQVASVERGDGNRRCHAIDAAKHVLGALGLSGGVRREQITFPLSARLAAPLRLPPDVLGDHLLDGQAPLGPSSRPMIRVALGLVGPTPVNVAVKTPRRR